MAAHSLSTMVPCLRNVGRAVCAALDPSTSSLVCSCNSVVVPGYIACMRAGLGRCWSAMRRC